MCACAGLGGGAAGTTIKFDSTKGTDTITKNGMAVPISTSLHCVTAAAHYMNKSMEVSGVCGQDMEVR